MCWGIGGLSFPILRQFALSKALVNICPGLLPGIDGPKPQGWRTTKLYINIVIGQRTRTLGKKNAQSLGVFFFTIQDPCIIVFDRQVKWKALEDEPRITPYDSSEITALHTTGKDL